jgi:hypothetical protein
MRLQRLQNFANDRKCSGRNNRIIDQQILRRKKKEGGRPD